MAFTACAPTGVKVMVWVVWLCPELPPSEPPHPAINTNTNKGNTGARDRAAAMNRLIDSPGDKSRHRAMQMLLETVMDSPVHLYGPRKHVLLFLKVRNVQL
ncbi:MAG: hypothetical protein ACRD3S_18415, partial [Terracidiphilus sp.]